MNEELGKLIVKRRQLLEVSQSELADLAEVSVHTLSNLESGIGNPTLKTLSRVLDALGLTIQVVVQ